MNQQDDNRRQQIEDRANARDEEYREGQTMKDANELLAKEIANAIASRRTGGSVYMDGSHSPHPSEITIGKRIAEGYSQRITTLETFIADYATHKKTCPDPVYKCDCGYTRRHRELHQP